jgi:hypothetical protein
MTGEYSHIGISVATQHKIRKIHTEFFFFLFAPIWELAPTFWSKELICQFLDHLQTVGLLGRVISPSQGLYLNTGQHKHTA